MQLFEYFISQQNTMVCVHVWILLNRFVDFNVDPYTDCGRNRHDFQYYQNVKWGWKEKQMISTTCYKRSLS